MSTQPELVRILRPGVPDGKDIQGVRRACRAFSGQTPPTASLKVQREFNASMLMIVKAAQDHAVVPKTGIVDPKGPLWEALLRAEAASRYSVFDLYARQLLSQFAHEYQPKPPIPKLGPICAGGASILSHSLTHETEGVPGFPAYDDGWRAGKAVLAPERCRVTEQSGAAGGDAFFLRGDSTIEYWIGHVAAAPRDGTVFDKGEKMAIIASIPHYQGGPHVHCGINARPLIGYELLHHTDYSYGAPTVGAQFKWWASR